MADLERPAPSLENGRQHLPCRRAVALARRQRSANNMLLGILMAGTSEAIALGVANGLDLRC